MIAVHILGIMIGLCMIGVAVFNWDYWFYDVDSIVIQWIGGEMMVRWYWGICGAMVIIATLIHWIWGKDMGWLWW